jgi:hypothetical protein
MRFVGLALRDPVPDAETIWLYREQLERASVAEKLFARFDALLRAKGWLAPKDHGGGQIIDATRRPRLTQAEKDVIRGGGTPAGWTPARARRSIATGAGQSSAAENARPHRAKATSVKSTSRSRCSAKKITSASLPRGFSAGIAASGHGARANPRWRPSDRRCRPTHRWRYCRGPAPRRVGRRHAPRHG